jgi:hypothetical protein
MTEGLERHLQTIHRASLKSEGERRIAETLDQYGIPFIYEARLQLKVRGVTKTFRPDFYLPDLDVYIEYYGRAGNEEYDRRTRKKQAAYSASGLAVISIYPWDLCQNWPTYLTRRLARFGPVPGRTSESGPPSAYQGGPGPDARTPTWRYAGSGPRKYR